MQQKQRAFAVETSDTADTADTATAETLKHKLGKLFAAGKDSPMRTRRILRFLSRAGLGFLFGACPLSFGAYPFGIAFLCAVPTDKLAVFCGLIPAMLWLSPHPAILLTVAVAVFLVRSAAAMLSESGGMGETAPPVSLSERPVKKQFSAVLRMGRSKSFPPDAAAGYGESVLLRIALGAVSVTAAGFAVCMAGGYRVWDLFGLLVGVPAAVVAVPVFSVLTDRRFEKTVPWYLSGGIALFGILWALRWLPGVGAALAVAGGCFTVAYTSDKKGVAWGFGAALAAGLAYAPARIPSFLLFAVGYTLLADVSRVVGLAAGVTGAVALTLWMGGIGEAAVFLPACLGGGAVAEMLHRLHPVTAANRDESKAQVKEDEPIPSPDRTLVACRKNLTMEQNIRDLSQAFSSLSELFFDLSDRVRRPALLDLRHECDRVMEKNCRTCPEHEVCWGLEYDKTADALGKLTSTLYAKGIADRTKLPEELLRRCPRADTLISDMNEACARLTGEALKGCRTEIFALDYEALSKILAQALEGDNSVYECDPILGGKVYEALKSAGLRTDGVAVYGGGRRRVLARGVDLLHADTDTSSVQTAVETACGTKMSRPVFEMTAGDSVMYMYARRRFSLRHAERVLPASGEGNVSGDSVSAFAGKEDRFCALICDGMGRGKEAALTSGICSVFLEKMLTAGNRAATAVRMLNTFIRSDGTCTGECTVTVDLCEIDLYTGCARFLKSGAAPSFVIRDGKVFRLETRTLPVGILPAPDSGMTRFDLLAGDTVVLVSDGIGDALGEKITDVLRSLGNDPDPAADRLIAAARLASSDPDDLSCAVLCVVNAPDDGI